MTPQEIADKLVAYCRSGDYAGAHDELYSDDVVSVEADGKTDSGKSALVEKAKKRNAMMKEFSGGYCSDPIVAGNFISVAMGFTCVYVGSEAETTEHEIAVYEVVDGKIVKEMFFYSVPQKD